LKAGVSILNEQKAAEEFALAVFSLYPTGTADNSFSLKRKPNYFL